MSIHQLSCSIVLYENEESIVTLVQALLEVALPMKVYLVDNSPSDRLRGLLQHMDVDYIYNNDNIGYGAGHNIAINRSLADGIKYHIVVNPDISFERGTIEDIYHYIDQHEEVGLIMPKVFYETGEIQRLCKLLPTPADLIFRRFFPNTSWSRKMNDRYELRNFDYNSVLNTPCLSGCFMFIRTEILHKSGIFDPRYFMYLEDYDLVRRIHRYARTIFLPSASVRHGFKKESFVNKKLLMIHIWSAIKYFNKWGWLRDAERKKFNNQVLQQIDVRRKS